MDYILNRRSIRKFDLSKKIAYEELVENKNLENI